MGNVTDKSRMPAFYIHARCLEVCFFKTNEIMCQCVNKEHIGIFHFWHSKVPAWEVLHLKHLQGKYGACIRNVRKLCSQAVASGSGITGHAIHLSNEPYIYTSGHLWQQAWHRSDSTWKPAGRFWARGSKQKRLGIEASCFRVSACWKVKSKYSWLFSDVLGVL